MFAPQDSVRPSFIAPIKVTPYRVLYLFFIFYLCVGIIPLHSRSLMSWRDYLNPSISNSYPFWTGTATLSFDENLQPSRLWPGMDDEQFSALTESASQGISASQYQLALVYISATSGKRDLSKAVRWLRLATESGFSPAQFMLGWCYEQGWGVIANQAEAVNLYSQAASKGFPEAKQQLGELYLAGKGVPRDHDQARQLFDEAHALGITKATLRLGECYLNGWGTIKNAEQAITYIQKAAGLDDPEAQELLANCYRDGIGVEKNLTEAVKWWFSADTPNARKQLAKCYIEGLGVAQNPEYAYYYLSSQKDADQVLLRDKLAALLKPPVRELIEKSALEFNQHMVFGPLKRGIPQYPGADDLPLPPEYVLKLNKKAKTSFLMEIKPPDKRFSFSINASYTVRICLNKDKTASVNLEPPRKYKMADLEALLQASSADAAKTQFYIVIEDLSRFGDLVKLVTKAKASGIGILLVRMAGPPPTGGASNSAISQPDTNNQNDQQRITMIGSYLAGSHFHERTQRFDTAPKLLGSLQFEYPMAARTAGIQGTVMLGIRILKNGAVDSAWVIRSVQAGPGGLDDIALKAIRKCRFSPALLNGKPVDVFIQYPFDFRLGRW